MTARRPEQALHRGVVANLEIRATPGTFWFHVPNGGWRTRAEGAIFKGLGVVPGVPDIICIKDGQVFALELKAEGGRLTPTQLECHARLRAAGAVVSTAVGIDAALRFLEIHKLVRGGVQ